jgi:hypothetical protein
VSKAQLSHLISFLPLKDLKNFILVVSRAFSIAIVFVVHFINLVWFLEMFNILIYDTYISKLGETFSTGKRYI